MGKQQGEPRNANHLHEGGEKGSPKAANVNGEIPSEEEENLTSTTNHGKLKALDDHHDKEEQAKPTTEAREEEKEAEDMETNS